MRKYRLRSSKVTITEKNGGKISLTEGCKEKIKNKVQAQSEHLTGTVRVADETPKEFLDVHRDIRTIMYHLREEQSIDLSVELYFDSGLYTTMSPEQVWNAQHRLGGITLFENSKIALTNTEQKVKLYVHYNNDQRSNAAQAHFDLRAPSKRKQQEAAAEGRRAAKRRRMAESDPSAPSTSTGLTRVFANILL